MEVQHLRQLVAETGALFGARHYRRYDFLLTLSDRMPQDGVEHHESSDDRTEENYFLDPGLFASSELLPHEFTHSWNGKYRRPAGLATPDYQTPMKGDLLWVYEGLTQYYGVMLAARSVMMPLTMFREYLASTAAYLNDRPGRTWRDLQDTAIAAQILYSLPPEGSSLRRSVDYYDESTLIWLEADTIIRKQSNGKKSLDDFCQHFHGGENTPPKVVPYTFDDVVTAMNEVAPYDWRAFFTARLKSHGSGAPLGGLENSGWKLVFTDVPNEYEHVDEVANQEIEMQFSLGLLLHGAGRRRWRPRFRCDSRVRLRRMQASHRGCGWSRSTAENGIQTFCEMRSPAQRPAKNLSSCSPKMAISIRPTGLIITAANGIRIWNLLAGRPIS